MPDAIDAMIDERILSIEAELDAITPIGEELDLDQLERLVQAGRDLNALVDDAERLGRDVRPRLSAGDRREMFGLRARLARTTERLERAESSEGEA